MPVYTNPNDRPNAEKGRDSAKRALTRPNRFTINPNTREQIENVLAWILHEKSFDFWWITPLTRFEELTPAEMVSVGRYEELFTYVQSHMEPIYS